MVRCYAMQTLTDAELLDAYSSRQDDTAFGELMKRHGAMVYRACHRMLKDAHEAEDASQAVFVVLARKAGGLRKNDLSAWLYRVAHHVAAETVRKRMHRVRREDTYAEDEAIQNFGSPSAEEFDPAVFGLVDAALLSLPERYRQAVILRYLQNHSQEVAAPLAGCTVGTLKWRASDGIAKLRTSGQARRRAQRRGARRPAHLRSLDSGTGNTPSFHPGDREDCRVDIRHGHDRLINSSNAGEGSDEGHVHSKSQDGGGGGRGGGGGGGGGRCRDRGAGSGGATQGGGTAGGG